MKKDDIFEYHCNNNEIKKTCNKNCIAERVRFGGIVCQVSCDEDAEAARSISKSVINKR